MAVSRKGPGHDYTNEQAEEDFEMTEADYLADKKSAQDRTGYPERTPEELAQKAVDEKLPSGSQSY